MDPRFREDDEVGQWSGAMFAGEVLLQSLVIPAYAGIHFDLDEFSLT